MKRFEVDKRGNDLITRESLTKYLMRQKDGKYAVEVKKWNGSKTWEQIKAIHGVVIPGISNYTGETIQEVKRRLKLDYGEVEYFEKDGETYVELKSYASYTKTQMREHIDKVLNHCEFDLGFVIDLETRKQLMIDEDTGELTEMDPMLEKIEEQFA